MKINNTHLKSIGSIIAHKIKQWKNYLPLINLVLMLILLSLVALCVILVNKSTKDAIERRTQFVKQSSENQVKFSSLKIDEEMINRQEYFLSNNPFSQDRTDWKPKKKKKPAKSKSKSMSQKEIKALVEEAKNRPKGDPKPIELKGILILGDIKKALIKNPDREKNKKPYIFIEEGQEIVDYTVKNISEDRIELDWYGEEHIVVMRSNIKQ